MKGSVPLGVSFVKRRPFSRLRRLRQSPILREMLAGVRLTASDLILPLFVREGRRVRKEVGTMPGVFQLSPDQVIEDLKKAEQLGVRAFILFGIVEKNQKDDSGRAALDPRNVICQTLKLIQNSGVRMMAITDLCFCEYTSHGHCGVLTNEESHHAGDKRGKRNAEFQTVDNDATLELLARQAVLHAQAGAGMIAPSAMMDGMVAAVRNGLDQAGFSHLPIMSYAVKYASAFYGPFRDAAESAPAFGDRRSYQMDHRRRREARLEARSDLEQGADILMVKPGLPYLDVLRDLRERVDLPLAAFQVSGEYAMIKAAAQKGWLDETAVMLETLTALKRAGADLILTYYAREAARVL